MLNLWKIDEILSIVEYTGEKQGKRLTTLGLALGEGRNNISKSTRQMWRKKLLVGNQFGSHVNCPNMRNQNQTQGKNRDNGKEGADKEDNTTLV